MPGARAGRGRLLVALLLEGRPEAEITGLRRAITGSAGRLAPHLTLVPPVNVAAADRPAALSLLRRAAADAAPLDLELGPAGTFSRARGVLFLSVHGDLDALGTLRSGLEAPPLASPTGRAPRPFVAHVTIASRLEAGRAEVLAAQLSAYRARVTCASLQLLEEVHEPAGRRWAVVASEALGGRSVRGRGGLEVAVQLADTLDPEVAGVVDAAWASAWREAVGEPPPARRPFAFVARRGEALLGAATGEVHGEVCELDRLVVVPGARGQGAGSRLLEAVERLAGESGCARVRLQALAGGEASAFFARRGFAVTAGIEAWRSGRDAVVMERRGSGPPGAR